MPGGVTNHPFFPLLPLPYADLNPQPSIVFLKMSAGRPVNPKPEMEACGQEFFTHPADHGV